MNRKANKAVTTNPIKKALIGKNRTVGTEKLVAKTVSVVATIKTAIANRLDSLLLSDLGCMILILPAKLHHGNHKRFNH